MSPLLIGAAGIAALLVLILAQVPIGIAMIIVGVVGYALQAGWGPALTILASEPSGLLASVDLATVPCIGDSLRDLQAADAAGAQPVLVLTGKGETTLRDGGFPKATMICPDLAFAVSALLGRD